MKNNLAVQFPFISFEKWKEEAQKSIDIGSIDEILEKQLTNKISINAIYDKSQVKNYFDLNFDAKQINNSNKISIDQITNLPLESDVELAVLLELIKINGYDSAIIELRIDSNFFLSIAKFRVMRYILSNDYKIPYKMIAYNPNFNKSITDNKNNIIRLTTEAMSAIIGGADDIRLTPFNSTRENDEFGKRVTENIKIILNNESNIDFVKDPLAGAYLVENLTQKFLDSINEYRNELALFKNENEIKEYVIKKATQYKEKIKNELDSQKRKLIGVNIYQNPKDNMENIELNDFSVVSNFEKYKQEIDTIVPKVYIANFEQKHQNQISLIMTMNTYNIKFQVSNEFELVEDAFNSIKLFDPDLVILNANKDIERNLRNMLDEYNITTIDEYSDKSILKNIDTIIEKIRAKN